jgi:molybdate transport system substrate-binding protein
MMMRGLLLSAMLGASLAGAAQKPEVVVSAAASLADVIEEVARDYEQRTGRRVVVNLGSSNTLARQIAAGARVDVFLSADAAQMNAVADEVVAGSRVDLLTNQLAIAVPSDRPRQLRSARELADPAFKRIALGDPAAVPAGVYARQYLERLGIWPQIQSRIVPTASVRLALASVEAGAVDAAVVYRTDLAAAGQARAAFIVPVAEGPKIVYPAALLRRGANRDEAARFLRFLRSPEAAATFMRAGFGLAQPGA